MELARIKIGIDARPAKQGAEEVKESLVNVRKETDTTGKHIADLERRLRELEKQAVTASRDVDKLRKAQEHTAKSTRELEKETTSFNFALALTGKTTDKATEKVKELSEAELKAIKRTKELAEAKAKATKRTQDLAASAATLAAAVGAVALAFDVVEDLVRFEKGLVGVGKTADLAGTALDMLGDRAVVLSVDTGKTTDEILEVAQAAGQLGVKGADDIFKFTDAIIKLGDASAGSLQGEDAAKTLARILNVTGDGVGKVTELANVIVSLGNSMAANEGEIANHANQVALATAAYDVSSAEAAALGGALAALGVRAELSGSAIGRTFRAIDAATRGGGKQLQVLEKILGLSGKEIKTLFAESEVKTLQRFLEGLGEIAAQGGDTTAVLDSLGLSGEEILKVLPTLAVNSDLVAQAFGLMNDQVNGGTALADEFARSQDTLGTELSRVARGFDAAKISMRDSNGALQSAAKYAADTISVLLGLDDANQASRASTEGLAAALKVAAVPATYLAITSLAGGVTSLAAVLPLATTRQWLFNAAVNANPYVLTASAIAALITGISLFDEEAKFATESADDFAKAIGVLADEADRVEDLGLILDRAVSKGDAGKEIQTYSQLIRELEAAYISLKKSGGEVTISDLSILTGKSQTELRNEAEKLGEDFGNYLIGGIAAVTGDKGLDAALKNISSSEDVLPVEFALDAIDKRIDELKAKTKGTKLLDFGSVEEESKLFSVLSSRWNKTVESFVKRSKSVTDSTLDRIESLELERQYIGMNADERAILLDSLQLEKTLRASGSKDAAALAHAYRDTAMALLEERTQREQSLAEEAEFDQMLETIIDKRANAKQAIEAMHTELAIESHVLSLNSGEQERVGALLAYAAQLRQAGVKNIVEETEAYERQLIVLQDQRAWRNTASAIAGTIGTEITDLLVGVRDFEDALQNISIGVARALIEKTVTDPLVDSLTTKLASVLPSLFGSVTEETAGATAAAGILEAAGVSLSGAITSSATVAAGLLNESAAALAAALTAGGVSQGVGLAGAAAAAAATGKVVGAGGIIPMAAGGVITGPSLFPMSNGDTILGGEKGYESIMPLGRDNKGRLGVLVADSGESKSSGNTFVNVKVYAEDPAAFRSSTRQIKDTVKRRRF
jgi:TP901 family phage tail tape measure protein